MKTVLKCVLPFLGAMLFAGCSGYLQVMGNVKDEDGQGVKSARVIVLTKKNDLLISASTDGDGHFTAGRKASRFAVDCKVVYQKHGYKSDTVMMQKTRGKCVLTCDHTMVKE